MADAVAITIPPFPRALQTVVELQEMIDRHNEVRRMLEMDGFFRPDREERGSAFLAQDVDKLVECIDNLEVQKAEAQQRLDDYFRRLPESTRARIHDYCQRLSTFRERNEYTLRIFENTKLQETDPYFFWLARSNALALEQLREDAEALGILKPPHGKRRHAARQQAAPQNPESPTHHRLPVEEAKDALPEHEESVESEDRAHE